MARSFTFNPFTGNLDVISEVSLGTSNGLSITTDQVLSLQLSDTTHTGALSSTDWNTFNNKQPAGNYITALTGDVTASGPGSAAATLATVNGNVGTFGSSTSIPTITVNAKGLITAASGNVVIAPAGTLSGTTLNATVVSSSLTSVGTITTGVWNGTTIAIANGGTGATTKAGAFDALSPMTTGGDLIYGGASGTGTRLANGSNGQYLTSSGGTSAPTWTSATTIACSLRYTNSTSSISSTTAIVKYSTVDYDTDTAYSTSTGLFTVPTGKAGKYHIKAQLDVSATFTVSNNVNLWIRKNGVDTTRILLPGVATGDTGAQISDTLSLADADTIGIYADTTGTSPSITNSAVLTNMCIFRVLS